MLCMAWHRAMLLCWEVDSDALTRGAWPEHAEVQGLRTNPMVLNPSDKDVPFVWSEIADSFITLAVD